MKAKKKFFKPRLPQEAVETLRRRGGAHSTKKGERGYSRKKEKERARKEKQGN